MAGACKKICSLLVTSLLIIFVSSELFAVDSRIIRVGYYESESFQSGSNNTEIKSGYSYEYLQKLAYFSGWKYVYIYGTWASLYQDLIDGKIDFLAGISKTKEREGKMLFPDFPMGTENYYLYRHYDDDTIRSSELSTLEGKTVAGVKKSLLTPMFEKWARENSVNVKIKEYDDFLLRDEAFLKGEVDCIVATDNEIPAGNKVFPVEKIGSEPYYMAVRKDRAYLLEEMNSALIELNNSEPFFIQNLQYKFFGKTAVNNYLSESETEWLLKHKNLKIGYLKNYLPYCQMDKSTGKLTGLLKDVIETMFHILDPNKTIKPVYIGFENYNNMVNELNAGKLDLLFPTSGGLFFSEQSGFYETAPVVTAGMNMVFMGSYGKEKEKRIAVNKNNKMQSYYVDMYFPDSEQIFCDSIEDCLTAIKNDEADSTIINGLRGNAILKNSKFKKFEMIQLPNTDDRCFGVQAGNKSLLKILNRGLNVLGNDFALNYAYKYSEKLYTYSAMDFFSNYVIPIIMFVMLVAAFIVYLLVRDIRKTRKQLKERLKYQNEIKNERKRNDLVKAEVEFKENVYHSLHRLIKSGMWQLFFNSYGNVERVEWSDELRSLFGFKDIYDFPDDFSSLINNVHEDDVEKIKKPILEAVAGNSGNISSDIEFRLKTKDKGERWFHASGDLIRREDGKPYCFFGIVFDVTDKKDHEELERSRDIALEQAYTSLVAINSIHKTLGSGQWTFFYNQNGDLERVEFNDDFRNLLGYKDISDFPDKYESFESRIYPDDIIKLKNAYETALAHASDNNIFDVNARFKTKSLGYRWFRCAGLISRREDGKPERLYGLFQDIDNKVKSDAALVDALAAAEKANVAKTTFLNSISHDIRTPLNAIIGFTKLAEKHLNDSGIVQDHLKKIKTSSDHLLSLINDVLDMSRIESGKVVLEEKKIHISDIYNDINTIIQPGVNSKNLKFSFEKININNNDVIADFLRVKQIFINILSNAIKYTPEGGSIDVKLKQIEPDSTLLNDKNRAYYEVTVKDTGIGMSDEFQKHIFEAFTRENSTTISGVEGTGLGLTITKSLVDMMQGSISLKSKEHSGTEITVCLDFEIADFVRDKNVKEQYENLDFTGKKILLVEDNDLNKEIAKTILEENGFIVETASDGDIAVEKIKGVLDSPENQFDGILMDIQMPRMNGYEATRQIRSLNNMYAITVPIIAMTANAFEEDKKEAMLSGMNEHVSKPIDVSELLNTLAKKLR